MLHKDFRIFPAPMKDAGGWRVAARIEKDAGGAVKVHQLIRSDVYADHEGAMAASLDKAKLAIDQLGDGIFG